MPPRRVRARGGPPVIPLAHIAGLPAEELLLPLAGGGGLALMAARAWAGAALDRLRRR